MKDREGKLINLAILGHFQSGKTTLAEQLAYSCGVISKCGSVENKNTISDFEPEETARMSSVSTSLISLNHNGITINLLDTPGDLNFEHEIVAGLIASEAAIILISATDGIQAGTEYVFDLVQKYKIPSMVLISKLDKDNAQFEEIIKELNNSFGSQFLAVGSPDKLGSGFNDFIYFLNQPNLPEFFLESVVSCDDNALEKYLSGEEIPTQEIAQILKSAIKTQLLTPVVGYGATKQKTGQAILNFIETYLPTFSGLSAFYSTLTLPETEDPVLYCIKTISDQYSGKLTIAKVLNGSLLPETILINQRTLTEEKIHQLHSLRGKEHITLALATVGDIVGLPKLNEARAGDILHPKNTSNVFAPEFPIERGITMVAIAPKDQHDDDKLMLALTRLSEEDPALAIQRVDETHQTLIYGNGDLHINVTLERLKRKYSVSVQVVPIVIPLRETITTKAQAEGKHKKQTGGHGQFGVAVIEIEPLERSKGFEFIDRIVGGAIPKQYIPAVEKGIKEQMDAGVIWGYPVIDVKVTLIDGKYHPVDSSELSFKLAGALAFREAMAKASPVLLEPISRLVVTVPIACQGDILADLNSRRGKVVQTQTIKEGKWQEIVALIPTSELLNYNAELKSLTASRGRAHFDFDHYDFLPSHLAEKIPKAHAKND